MNNQTIYKMQRSGYTHQPYRNVRVKVKRIIKKEIEEELKSYPLAKQSEYGRIIM